MASNTVVGNFNYTGTNPNLTALVSGAAWQSPNAVVPIDYYFQSGADPFNFSGIASGNPWSSVEQQAFNAAAAQWNAVANIDFRQTTNQNNADAWAWQGSVAEVDALGWAEFPDGAAVEPLYIVFAYNADGWTTAGLNPGGYGYLTILHEIGHLLGLAHPHDAAGDSSILPGVNSPFGSYGTNNLNQGIFTVMSYNDGWPEHYPNFGIQFGDENYGYAITPAALDIAAIQEIYGPNMNHATGDDVYVLPDQNVSGTGWSSIWDAGGTDEFTAEGSTRDFNIDLREAPLTGANAGGYVSFSEGIFGGMTIANGVTIENATGGDGNDTVRGNDVDNVLMGNGGDDSLIGSDGDDTLDGGGGGDVLDGGAGRDVASYESATRSVRVDLQNDALMFNDAVGDTFVDIEVFQTGSGVDQLRGDAGDNEFYTGGVSDRLYGRAGDDLLFGEAGADAFYGGLGADIMTGGDDAGRRDRYIYFNAAETGVGSGNRDVITDFVSGEDRIEISRIDADLTTGGKQGFNFIGDAAFTGTGGELRYEQTGGNTIVQADRDGDGAADFEIELTGTMDLIASDFLI